MAAIGNMFPQHNKSASTFIGINSAGNLWPRLPSWSSSVPFLSTATCPGLLIPAVIDPSGVEFGTFGLFVSMS